ncbi:isocitrate/isopropylmalate family dehydrogenase [Escherichia coli]
MRIAAIPGDGIGKEVLPEGIRVFYRLPLSAGASPVGLSKWSRGELQYYSHHGKMMPDDWHEQLSRFDAIYFGAVGWPDTVASTIFRCGVRC